MFPRHLGAKHVPMVIIADWEKKRTCCNNNNTTHEMSDQSASAGAFVIALTKVFWKSGRFGKVHAVRSVCSQTMWDKWLYKDCIPTN